MAPSNSSSFLKSTKGKPKKSSKKQHYNNKPKDEKKQSSSSSSSSLSNNKKVKASFDRNGLTTNIAHGMSAKQAKDVYNTLQAQPRSQAEKELIERYRTNNYNSNIETNRIEALRKDDNDNDANIPDLSNNINNAFQLHAIQIRNRRNKSKAVQSRLQIHKTKRYQAAIAAANAQVVLHTESAGIMEPEHDMEKTYQLSQTELKRNHLNEQSARQIFDLQLETYNPYGVSFDLSGRHAILFGQNGGHVALMDYHDLSLTTEFHVQDKIHDAIYLHNATMMATAQSNHVYIYDDTGAEIHKLNDHRDPYVIDFLPHHWLLASIGRLGWLKYQDTSTGQLVAQHQTKLGPCHVLCQNKYNAVLHTGHSNGTVSLWSPASSQYLVKMACHKGAPITSMAIDQTGTYMVTGGMDKVVKIWDLRMYQMVHQYYTISGTPTALDLSQQNILGIGHGGNQATFWSSNALKVKLRDPYMTHKMPGCGVITSLKFRPFEDVCAIGHNKGISSIVIPGSGEPNIDTTEYNTNPFLTKSQRREQEVRSLLDKLDPNMIGLDPNAIGGMEESNVANRKERLRDIQDAANGRMKPKKKQKNKKRGRSKIQTKLRRKENAILEENTAKLRKSKQEGGKKDDSDDDDDNDDHYDDDDDIDRHADAPLALKRFF